MVLVFQDCCCKEIYDEHFSVLFYIYFLFKKRCNGNTTSLKISIISDEHSNLPVLQYIMYFI